jgi:hypothetical protein
MPDIRTYQIGGDPRYEDQPLPDFLPTVLPAGWERLDITAWADVSGLDPDPAYARAYRKYGTLFVVLSCARHTDGRRWLHVSVSRRNQEVPSWAVMCEVKDLFIGHERTAIQVHPPREKWVNIHKGCLHLWCCLDGEILPDFTAGGETI